MHKLAHSLQSGEHFVVVFDQGIHCPAHPVCCEMPHKLGVSTVTADYGEVPWCFSFYGDFGNSQDLFAPTPI